MDGECEGAGPGRTGELHALVLAGGFGRRLESLTRRLFGEAIPKQFCSFGNRHSLLQETIVRLVPLVPTNRLTVVVDASQVGRAQAQLRPFRGAKLVVQPCDRGTAAGVLLPLRSIASRAPDALVVLAASDHGVVDAESFRATLRRAEAAVREHPERLVLVGADAAAPTTDYGWIVRGAPLAGDLDRVARFIEKPERELAESLWRSGAARWNTMVLVATARALLALFERQLPELVAAMARLPADVGVADSSFARRYAELTAANFSAEVLGTAGDLAVVTLPARAGWTDLGTEERMAEWLARRPAEAAEQLAEA